MKRFVALATVAVLTLTAWTATAAQTPTTAQATPCSHHRHPAAEQRELASHVFAYRNWRSPKPGKGAVATMRVLRGCVDRSVRRKMATAWQREKADLNRYRQHRLRWGRCTDAGPVADCIHGAALTYGADEGWLIAVSMCESEWDRDAHNPSGATSIFQFLPSTWETTPYGNRSIWSVKYQSLAAAWMYVVGRGGEWVCAG